MQLGKVAANWETRQIPQRYDGAARGKTSDSCFLWKIEHHLNDSKSRRLSLLKTPNNSAANHLGAGGFLGFLRMVKICAQTSAKGSVLSCSLPVADKGSPNESFWIVIMCYQPTVSCQRGSAACFLSFSWFPCCGKMKEEGGGGGNSGSQT